MKLRSFEIFAVLASLLVSGGAWAQDAAGHPVTFLDDVRISVDHRADADGYIRFDSCRMAANRSRQQ